MHHLPVKPRDQLVEVGLTDALGDARLQRGDQRHVIGRHAELAFGAGDIHLLDVAGKRKFLR